MKRPRSGCCTPRHISTRSRRMSLRLHSPDRMYTMPTVTSKYLCEEGKQARVVGPLQAALYVQARDDVSGVLHELVQVGDLAAARKFVQQEALEVAQLVEHVDVYNANMQK